HDIGFDCLDSRVGQIQTLRHGTRETFDYQVTFPDQVASETIAFWRSQVQIDRFLTVVEHVVEAVTVWSGFSIRHARGIDATDIDINLRLYFDHFGAHGRQPLGDLRPVDDPAEIGHADSFQRKRCHQITPAA